MELKFYGHACFTLTTDQTTLLFDPFFTDNPFQIAQISQIQADYIFVSHGHFDHLGDALKIAKSCNATIISTAEIAHLATENGYQAHAMHLGGTHEFSFGTVRVTLAFHGSGIPGGHACGFIVKVAGKTIYFAGDTALFGDMQLLGQLEKIDYALLPIGDNFTMGPNDATIACKLLAATHVIPIHYNTWPLINQDPNLFKQQVEKLGYAQVLIVNPGEKITL